MRKDLSVTLIAVKLAARFPWLSAGADNDQPRKLIRHGLFDHFGLPISIVDLGSVVLVRTKRAVLHQWKNDVA